VSVRKVGALNSSGDSKIPANLTAILTKAYQRGPQNFFCPRFPHACGSTRGSGSRQFVTAAEFPIWNC